MKAILYLVFTVFFIPGFSSLHSQTIVNSYNGVDTVWQKSKSPYRITGNIVIPPGRSLTIEPGTEVLFRGNYSVSISHRATLNCTGTAADKIRLKGDSLITTGDSTKIFYIYWSGIIASQADTSAIEMNLSLEHCIIEHSGGITCNGRTRLRLSYCGFYNNSQCINTRMSSGASGEDTISDCVFSNNSIVLAYTRAAKTNLFNSSFTKADLFNYTPLNLNRVSGCTISDCGITRLTVKTINESVFENCSAPDNTRVMSGEITGCRFTNTKLKGNYTILMGNTNGGGGDKMSNTTLAGFHLPVQTAGTATSKIRISGCNFYNNDTALLLGSTNNFSNIISCNSIEHNSNGIICSSAQMDSIINNIICHNTLYNVKNASSVTQNLTRNCFCASGIADAESKIYDIADDNSKGAVNYNIYGVSGGKNCETLDTVVAKDPTVLTESDTVLGVDINCVDYKTAPFITLNTPDTICVLIGSVYVSTEPTITSGLYESSSIALTRSGAPVNSMVIGLYTENWKAEDPAGNITYKTRYVRVARSCDPLSSVNDLSLSGFRVGPNPAGSTISIFVQDEDIMQTMSISLFSVDGRLVYSSRQAKTNTAIDIADLPAGIYSLQVVSSDKIISRKIMVQR